MATWLTVGPMTFRDVMTHTYDAPPYMSEDGVQQLGRRHTLVVTVKIGQFANQNNWKFSNPGGPDWSMVPNVSSPDEAVHAIQQVLAIPRQRVVYTVNNTIMFDSGVETCDALNGPFISGISVVQIKGSGIIIARFKVSATIRQAAGGETDPWLSTRLTSYRETDGDTWLSTRVSVLNVTFDTSILQSLALADDDPRRQCDHWIDRLGIAVPKGFKRLRAKVEVASDASKGIVTFVDQEQVLPLGSLSPATKLTPVYTVHAGLGTTQKEGVAISGGMLQIDGICPKNTARYDVLKMMSNLVIIKLAQCPAFNFFTDATVSYDLENNRVQMIAKAVYKPPIAGPNGLHLDINAGLNAIQDYADIDQAFFAAKGDGEGQQGSGRMTAVAPAMQRGGTAGSYLGLILNNIISASTNASLRASFDAFGKTRFCNNLDIPEGENEYGDDFVRDDTDEPFNTDEDDQFELYGPYESEVFAMPSQAGLGYLEEDASWMWEMVSMSTRYIYQSGKAQIPVSGAMPGYTGDPLPQCMVVDLHSPVGDKAVTWCYSSIGIVPGPLPSEVSGDPDDVFLYSELQPASPCVVANGKMGWTISGTYYYARKNQGAVKPGTIVATGRLPNAPGNQVSYNIGVETTQAGLVPKGGPADLV